MPTLPAVAEDLRSRLEDARLSHPTAATWVRIVLREVQDWLRSYQGVDLLAEGPTL